jgi:rhomboid protease GluP
MAPMIVFVAVVLGLVLRRMTPEERRRMLHLILGALRFAWQAVTKAPPGSEGFQEALRVRTRWAFVTLGLAVVNVAVFLGMLFGAGAFSDPQTIIGWGGGIGTRTTNGEWWRLGTAMFVHWGILHLVADLAGLVQTGRLLERLVGPFAFSAVFVASGLLAAVWGVAVHPVSVTVGASGAIFGLYGLLIATLLWGLVERSASAIPFAALKGLWPGIAIFLVYHVVTEGLVSSSMQAGLVVGFVCGAVLTGRVISHKPPVRRVCAALAATVGIVVICAAPLRGLADINGEVALVKQMETRTATAYDSAVVRFQKGRMDAKELAALAEAIASEMEVLNTHLASISNVPRDHQSLFTAISDYVKLREDSWRLRAEGLRAGQMATLQKADIAQRAALTALEQTSASERN